MEIKFYNTLTNATETFQPADTDCVRMYSCGPTVYDFAHIGNFRSFLFADVIRRTLEFFGHKVHHVMNITDVGHMTDDANADGGGQDKMQAAAARVKEDKKSGKVPEGAVQNPDDPYQIAEYYMNAFLDDAKLLGVKVASEPDNILRATENIDVMQEMITQLLKNGHAYVGPDRVVYYSVESFPAYGKLSGNTLDRLLTGAGGRISDENQSNKKHPADFMLWKPDHSHIMKWKSPWGMGYPGWHIECSCMARKRLGRDVIDIHTGGEDLIFPHHECEIAQTCGATGKDKFANIWMHARFLMVEGEKMSKSKGNFWTVRDVLEGRATGTQVHPAVLRLELIKSHYRANMNFTKKGLLDSAGAVKRLTDFRAKLEAACGGKAEPVDLSYPILKEFAEALADDLNISGALGAILPWASSTPDDAGAALGALNRINDVLAVAPLGANDAGSGGASSEQVEIESLCRQIDDARQRKDWPTADGLRKDIESRGYNVKNSPNGTIAEKRLA
ncbi:MAG: cysteine--tRNA ligase [Planctomycetales bacterium]|jgi:cysteinyl-tRNA synthetase|nr:cysteine--tRNA ligase [Planctomycetales bacterium]